MCEFFKTPEKKLYSCFKRDTNEGNIDELPANAQKYVFSTPLATSILNSNTRKKRQMVSLPISFSQSNLPYTSTSQRSLKAYSEYPAGYGGLVLSL